MPCHAKAFPEQLPIFMKYPGYGLLQGIAPRQRWKSASGGPITDTGSLFMLMTNCVSGVAN